VILSQYNIYKTSEYFCSYLSILRSINARKMNNGLDVKS